MATLRSLQIDDLNYMYEWMTDSEVTKYLVLTRMPFSKDDLLGFIKNSWRNDKDIHFAIADDNDEYVGTISLKSINYTDRNAEYAIAMRRKYWGKNYAMEATKRIIDFGFNKLNLHKIYLNVPASNIRAHKFYTKFGFQRENIFKEHLYLNGIYEDLIWYCILNNK